MQKHIKDHVNQKQLKQHILEIINIKKMKKTFQIIKRFSRNKNKVLKTKK